MDISEKLSLHKLKVEKISSLVKDHASNVMEGDYFSLRKASVSHTVPQPYDPKHKQKKINIADLTEIIQIDPENQICIAESGVSFEKLVPATLKHGLVPMTVSELKGITIGGAVAGCSVESMSFKYGGFHDSCLEYEIITGVGEIITCIKDKNEETFEMIHGSFGTLGILTMIKFKLVPAKPFVKIDYVKYSSFDDLMEAIRNHYIKKDIEMMDALIHSPTNCLLCIGTFVDNPPYNNKYKYRIYYKSTIKRNEDYLRTEDYFFRYDADCHWSTRNYGMENKLLRLILGPFALGSTKVIKWANRFPFKPKKDSPPDVIVDVFIPNQNMDNFWNWYQETFDYYPLWIVPYKIENRYPWINSNLMKDIKDDLFIDCAIYGFQQKDGKNYYKLLEDKVFELKGIKTLITHNYYEKEMFWNSYNKDMYDKVKNITDPKNIFRNLYDKMVYHK
jgi:FAD/FMN-containing dehydrogenase